MASDRKPLTFEQIAEKLYKAGDQASFRFRYRRTPVTMNEMIMVREKPRYSDDPKDHYWVSFGTDFRQALDVRPSLRGFQTDLRRLFRRWGVKQPVEVDAIPYPGRRLF